MTIVQVTLSDEELEVWKEAARNDDRPLASFVRYCVNNKIKGISSGTPHRVAVAPRPKPASDGLTPAVKKLMAHLDGVHEVLLHGNHKLEWRTGIMNEHKTDNDIYMRNAKVLDAYVENLLKTGRQD